MSTYFVVEVQTPPLQLFPGGGRRDFEPSVGSGDWDAAKALVYGVIKFLKKQPEANPANKESLGNKYIDLTEVNDWLDKESFDEIASNSFTVEKCNFFERIFKHYLRIIVVPQEVTKTKNSYHITIEAATHKTATFATDSFDELSKLQTLQKESENDKPISILLVNSKYLPAFRRVNKIVNEKAEEARKKQETYKRNEEEKKKKIEPPPFRVEEQGSRNSIFCLFYCCGKRRDYQKI